MATHYGSAGDTSGSNSENHSKDDNDSQIDNLENIETTHQAGLRDDYCCINEIEQLCQIIKTNDSDPRDAINHLEHKLNELVFTFCTNAPTEPIGEVLSKYTNTLCNAQKKMSLERSLLQDITVLDGNDSSQLEDWFTDIEITS